MNSFTRDLWRLIFFKRRNILKYLYAILLVLFVCHDTHTYILRHVNFDWKMDPTADLKSVADNCPENKKNNIVKSRWKINESSRVNDKYDWAWKIEIRDKNNKLMNLKDMDIKQITYTLYDFDTVAVASDTLNVINNKMGEIPTISKGRIWRIRSGVPHIVFN